MAPVTASHIRKVLPVATAEDLITLHTQSLRQVANLIKVGNLVFHETTYIHANKFTFEMRRNFLSILLLIFSLQSLAQKISNDILTKRWDAQWIAAPEASPHAYGVYHFRKTFLLNNKPASFVVHVSADNRYKLFVNDTMVSLGPARADLFHWNYETVDIAKYLRAGVNVIASVVWNYGDYKPEHQISFRTGFILQGDQ